jgi:hypothetical protein
VNFLVKILEASKPLSGVTLNMKDILLVGVVGRSDYIVITDGSQTPQIFKTILANKTMGKNKQSG